MHLTLYCILLVFFIALITVLNLFVFATGASNFSIILWGLLNPVLIIAIDGIFASIVHNVFPLRWMNPYRKCFYSSRKELSFYRKTKINTWKNFIPDTGKITAHFSKEHIDSTDPKYLYRFLQETCQAEWVHYAMCFAGFLTMIYAPEELLLTMFLPQCIVNFVLNVPPVLIQRNNRPKLINMYEHMTKSKEI